MRFKAKSVIVLKHCDLHWWSFTKGTVKLSFSSLYATWQKTFGAIEDKDRITKIRIEVTREK